MSGISPADRTAEVAQRMARADAAAARGAKPRSRAATPPAPTADQLWAALARFSARNSMELSLTRLTYGRCRVRCSLTELSSKSAFFDGETLTEALTMAARAFELKL